MLRSVCVETLLYLSADPVCTVTMLREGVGATLERIARASGLDKASGADKDSSSGDDGTGQMGDEEDTAELRANCARTIINIFQPLIPPTPTAKAEDHG